MTLAKYTSANNLGDNSYVVDLWPRRARSLELVRDRLILSGLQPFPSVADFEIVEVDDTLAQLLIYPWHVTRSVRRGFLNGLIDACELDGARIRAQAHLDNDQSRPTQLVFRCLIADAERLVAKHGGMSEAVRAATACWQGLNSYPCEAYFLGTPLGAPHAGMYEGLRRLGADTQLEWSDGSLDWVLSVSLTSGIVQMRIRADKGADLSWLQNDFARAANELSALGLFGPPYQLVSGTSGGFVAPTDSIDRPQLKQLFALP